MELAQLADPSFFTSLFCQKVTMFPRTHTCLHWMMVDRYLGVFVLLHGCIHGGGNDCRTRGMIMH